MKMNDIAGSIIYSKAKTCVNFKSDSLRDTLNFGFSYVESKDHVVNYLVTNGTVMKKILASIPETVLCPSDEDLGELWTAKLLVSNKIKDSQILFSNGSMSIVINLNLNKEFENAGL